MSRKDDIWSLNFVQWEWLEKKSVSQLYTWSGRSSMVETMWRGRLRHKEDFSLEMVHFGAFSVAKEVALTGTCPMMSPDPTCQLPLCQGWGRSCDLSSATDAPPKLTRAESAERGSPNVVGRRVVCQTQSRVPCRVVNAWCPACRYRAVSTWHRSSPVHLDELVTATRTPTTRCS